ncbi:MAG: chemotaxis protein CheR [Candidatus Methylomirabilota bacterium]|nr:protein-glutamate O-methyltransferase CheR [Candidatus Methylomirabilis sp.]NJD67211.1 protein-glutamate O-methyltransferase CheR [candidate division NC10 bacterium]PWB43511.1 MAG: chemotaxis protein CheR [candidate division NC10 bacterium]
MCRRASPVSRVFPEVTISDQEFRLFQDLVKAHTGIALTEHKRNLVCSRLGKRLRTLRLTSFQRYYDYLCAETGQAELEHFVNAITTNKTDFYREQPHFDFLAQELVPAWKTRAARTGERRIRIWSAGCSTGEEPYTIAITLRQAMDNLLGWDVRILASDIDTEVLVRAAQGVYTADRVAEIPKPTLERYFRRGKGAHEGLVQVAPEARNPVTFRRINLQEEPWPIRTHFDCIFCRNVIIYFDKPTQHRLMERFAAYLTDDGHLFLGHSESLYGMGDQFLPLRNTIYRKREERKPTTPTAAETTA